MKRYKFSAIIQRSSGWGAFVIFPYDVPTEFGIKGRVPVQAKLGKLPYTGSLMTCGTAASCSGAIRCTPATPGISRYSCMSSRQMRRPSAL